MDEKDSAQIISDVATGANVAVKVINIWRIVTSIIFDLFAIVIGLILIGAGVPVYIGIAVIVIPIFFTVMQFVTNNRTATGVNKLAQEAKQFEQNVATSPAATATPAAAPVASASGEVISGQIFGIMKAGFGIRSVEVLGAAGEIRNPENTMVVTNKRVAFIYVAVPGGTTTVDGFDAGMWENLLGKGIIKAEYDKMMASMSLDQAIAANPSNKVINLSDIKEVSFGKVTATITFVTATEKLSYSITSRAGIDEAKRLFAAYIK